MQRIELLRSSLEDLEDSTVTLLNGELCLISLKNNNEYNSLVIGDGITKANKLSKIYLDKSNGCSFLGLATPKTDPGKPKNNVFYLAKEEGTYENFGAITVNKGEIVFIVWKYESWNKLVIFETSSMIDIINSKVEDLEKRAILGVRLGGLELKRGEDGFVDIIVDDELNSKSNNPIKNKAVAIKLNEFDWYEGD